MGGFFRQGRCLATCMLFAFHGSLAQWSLFEGVQALGHILRVVSSLHLLQSTSSPTPRSVNCTATSLHLRNSRSECSSRAWLRGALSFLSCAGKHAGKQTMSLYELHVGPNRPLLSRIYFFFVWRCSRRY